MSCTPIVARSPWKTALEVVLSFVTVFIALECVCVAIGVDPIGARMMDVASLQAALAFVGIDLAVGLVLIRTLFARLREELPIEGEVPQVSVLLPLWNEGVSGARKTIEAWASQRGVGHELLVGDDGSTDGSSQALVDALGLAAVTSNHFTGEVNGTRVQLFRLPHSGKGATLNALSRHAQHAVLVTVDADTIPTEGSLRRLAAAFRDEQVDMATGVVSISNGRDGWLLGNQSAEYLKNALVRIAWSTLGGLDQVPGAFTGIRANVFHAVGGLPEDSLTEDYELTFRVMEHGVERGRAPKVATVLRAQVFTQGPSTVKGFIRQRTRWFAGFISTLLKFRRLIFDPRAGAYGLVRLPLKCLDAVLPALAFASLVVLVRGGVVSALGISRLSLTLFAVRWVWDLIIFAMALTASKRLGDGPSTERAAPPLMTAWFFTGFEALTYVWLKHAAALRGTAWAMWRLRRWETSREPTPEP